MFAITSFSDVVTVAKTFGVSALRYAMDNRTVSPDATRTIRECMVWAVNKTISIDNFNDGNVEFSVDAGFSVEKISGMHITGLNHITITRTGFGSWKGSAREAIEQLIITPEQLRKVLNEIGKRNAAAEALGF